MKFLGMPSQCPGGARAALGSYDAEVLTLGAARWLASAKSLSRRLGVIFIVLAGNARACSCRKLLLQFFTKASSHTFCWPEEAEVPPSDE